jgi:N-acetylglucosaminyl-diphospho-decaprenol L-rhamnosyltransferase
MGNVQGGHAAAAAVRSGDSEEIGLESLTAVIVNWETPDYTLRSARALQDDGVPPHRLVVVDNGSSDSSYERFRAELPGCVLIRLEENIGYTRAANTGAGALAGTSYLFVNNDAFVHERGSVLALLAALQNESVGVVVPRILNEDLTLQPKVVPVQTPGVALVRASGLSRLIPNRWQPLWSTHWDHSESREIQASSGTVMLVRGATWQDLGAFDDRIFLYAEDLDFCWRARKRGWKVWFTSEAEFVHLGSQSTVQHWGSPRRAEMIGKSEAQVIRRHLPPASARLSIGFISAGLALRWLMLRMLGRSEAAAAVWAAIRGYRRQERHEAAESEA